jgi:hypothetical protein
MEVGREEKRAAMMDGPFIEIWGQVNGRAELNCH